MWQSSVEDVGFRSTWIRTPDNSLVSIPNNSVVNAAVENLTLRKMFRERLVLQVTYDTPRERLETFARRLQQLIEEHPTTHKTTIRVRFNDFGESSLNILVIFHLVVADDATELGTRDAAAAIHRPGAGAWRRIRVPGAHATRRGGAVAGGFGIDSGAMAGVSGAARRGPIGLVEQSRNDGADQ